MHRVTLRNAKAVKLDDMWQIGPGVKCMIKDKVYLYVGRGVDNIGKYVDLQTSLAHYEDDEEMFDMEEIYVDVKPDVNLLFMYKVKELLSLYEDGWTVDGAGLNINSELDELATLAAIRKVVNDADSE